jgi:hypothetical protein
MGRRPQHRPLGVVHRQPDAVALGKDPGREVHLDIQREPLARRQVSRLAGRLAVRAVEGGARDLRHGAVRRHVGQAGDPVGARRVCADPQPRQRKTEDFGVRRQRRRIVDQAEGVGRPLVRRHVAPPHYRAAALDAAGGHVAQAMHRGLGAAFREAVVRPGEQFPPLDAPDRPARLPAPAAGRVLQIRPGRVPVAHIHGEARLFEDAAVDTLQPMVEPAHGLAPPFHAGLRVGFVRPGVRPGADQRLDRRLDVFQHARQAVAVAVVPAADVEGRDADALVLVARRGAVPERPVALLLLVGQHPRLGVEAILEISLVDHVVRRARPRVVEVLAHFPGVEVHDAVHVVDVVLVEVLGGVHRDDGLQRRRLAYGHLDRIEAAPGNAEHADAAVRPRLPGQPVDHHLAVRLFDVGVLVRDQPPLAVAGAADVHAGHHVAALDKVRVQAVVARARLGLAVGQVFQQHRAALRRSGRCRPVHIGSKANAVRQRDPDLFDRDVPGGGVAGDRAGFAARRRGDEQQGTQDGVARDRNRGEYPGHGVLNGTYARGGRRDSRSRLRC